MVALLYDVHGNLPALEAVLADAGEVDRYVLGGDYALFGAHQDETLELLRSLPADWIRGNGERWTADPAGAPDDEVTQGAIAASVEALGRDAVARLAALPERIELDDDTVSCHASPLSDVRGFAPADGADDHELLAGLSPKRLTFGHTHLQFTRTSEDGVELVNPGSVGMPFDGDPRAAYALLDSAGRVELRRVPYDHGRAAADVRARFGDWAELVARRIETASFLPADDAL